MTFQSEPAGVWRPDERDNRVVSATGLPAHVLEAHNDRAALRWFLSLFGIYAAWGAWAWWQLLRALIG